MLRTAREGRKQLSRPIDSGGVAFNGEYRRGEVGDADGGEMADLRRDIIFAADDGNTRGVGRTFDIEDSTV